MGSDSVLPLVIRWKGNSPFARPEPIVSRTAFGGRSMPAHLSLGNTWVYSFDPDDDVILKFYDSATVEDAFCALSDVKNAAFPPTRNWQ
jgi:hypothetical protein